MKTVTICNPQLKRHEICKQWLDFKLCNQTIPIAVLDVEEHFNSVTEDTVLVKVTAFSCNYRDKSFMLHFNEQCKERSVAGCSCYLPFGSEFAGVIIDKGSKVKALNIGDRVMLDATYPIKSDGSLGGLPTNCASQRIQLFKQSYLKKIPDGMPNKKAAVFALAGQTCYSIIRKLELHKGQNILITAATSNTSIAAIMALRNKDVNIYACSSTNIHKDKLLELGVHHFILKSELETGSFTHSSTFNGFDAIIDPFSDIYSLLLIGYMKNGGKYITCGTYSQNHLFEKRREVPNELSQMISYCITKNVTFIGSCLGSNEDLDSAIKDYQKGEFDIIIDSVWKSDLSSFLNRTFNQPHRFGKVIYEYED